MTNPHWLGAEDRRPMTFSLELVGTVARSLLAQIRRGEEPDTILSNFLPARKLRVVDEASLFALEELADYSRFLSSTAAEKNEDKDEDSSFFTFDSDSEDVDSEID
jgi:hypothetical protein